MVSVPDGAVRRVDRLLGPAVAEIATISRAIFLGRLTVLIEEAEHWELLIVSAEPVLEAIGVVGFAEEEAASLRRQVRLAQWSLTDGPAERISLAGKLITIDAMGRQKAIVEVIEDGGDNFVIAVKDDQPTLRETIETHFEKHLEGDLEDLRCRRHETHEDAHGRIDERSYSLTKVPTEGSIWEDRPSVKAIGYALRVTQVGDGPEAVEVRY